MSVLKYIQGLRVPIISLLLTALFCTAFVSFKKQDEAVWTQVSEQYQHQLLQLELPVYRDFVTRRWDIERLGSAEYLQQLTSYINVKANDKLSRMILSDHLFYPYLLAEGHFFISPDNLKVVHEKRRAINLLIDSLSKNRFALSMEHYAPSNLVSYVFVDQNPLRFAINLLIFFVFSIFIERAYGPRWTLSLIFLSSLSTSAIYLLDTANNSASLQSSSGIIFGLSAAVLMHLYRQSKQQKRYVKNVTLTLLLLFLLASKLYEESLINLITSRDVIAYLFAGLMAILFMMLNHKLYRLSLANDKFIAEHDLDEQAVSLNPKTNWAFRVELGNAMEFISQFNFDKARNVLKVLREKHPHSVLVLEQQYHLEKLQPDDGEYWLCANELIQLSVKKRDYARIKRLFHDIQRNAATKERARVSLKPDNYHKMMMVFVQHDDLTKAEQAFMFLELAGQTDIIKDACTLLIEEFKVREMTTKKQQYQMLYERLV